MSFEMKTCKVTTGVPLDPSKPKGPGNTKTIELSPAEYPEFSLDSAGLGDAQKWFETRGGIGKLIERINAQVKTDAMNEIRSEYNRPISETTLHDKAMERAVQDESTMAQIRAHASDFAWVKTNIIRPLMEQIRTEMTAERANRAPVAAESEEVSAQ